MAVDACRRRRHEEDLYALDPATAVWRLNIELPRTVAEPIAPWTMDYDPVHDVVVATIPSGFSRPVQTLLFRYDPSTASSKKEDAEKSSFAEQPQLRECVGRCDLSAQHDEACARRWLGPMRASYHPSAGCAILVNTRSISAPERQSGGRYNRLPRGVRASRRRSQEWLRG